AGAPLRRTQTGEFFKRDLERLRADPLLNGPPVDSLTELPDAGLLVVALALGEGILREIDGELRAVGLPAAWEEGLPAALASLWAALPNLTAWNPRDGWCGPQPAANPYPSAYLLALLLVSRLPEGPWAQPAAVGKWVVDHPPFWSGE